MLIFCCLESMQSDWLTFLTSRGKNSRQQMFFVFLKNNRKIFLCFSVCFVKTLKIHNTLKCWFYDIKILIVSQFLIIDYEILIFSPFCSVNFLMCAIFILEHCRARALTKYSQHHHRYLDSLHSCFSCLCHLSCSLSPCMMQICPLKNQITLALRFYAHFFYTIDVNLFQLRLSFKLYTAYLISEALMFILSFLTPSESCVTGINK